MVKGPSRTQLLAALTACACALGASRAARAQSATGALPVPPTSPPPQTFAPPPGKALPSPQTIDPQPGVPPVTASPQSLAPLAPVRKLLPKRWLRMRPEEFRRFGGNAALAKLENPFERLTPARPRRGARTADTVLPTPQATPPAPIPLTLINPPPAPGAGQGRAEPPRDLGAAPFDPGREIPGAVTTGPATLQPLNRSPSGPAGRGS